MTPDVSVNTDARRRRFALVVAGYLGSLGLTRDTGIHAWRTEP
jgi:hypothetical protein